jgi:hypothetical protein
LMARTAGNGEGVEHFQHAPEAHAIAVFMPGPVGDVGHGRPARRRSDDGPGHRLVDVPFLDVDDDPHGQARAVRQYQRRPLTDRGVGQSFVRQHGDLHWAPAQEPLHSSDSVSFQTHLRRAQPCDSTPALDTLAELVAHHQPARFDGFEGQADDGTARQCHCDLHVLEFGSILERSNAHPLQCAPAGCNDYDYSLFWGTWSPVQSVIFFSASLCDLVTVAFVLNH